MIKFFHKWFSNGKSERQSRSSISLEEPSTSTASMSNEEPQGTEMDSAAKVVQTGLKLTSSVIQSTVVEDRHSVIPSVTLLVLGDTAGRLTRVMDKLDALGLDSPELERKNK